VPDATTIALFVSPSAALLGVAVGKWLDTWVTDRKHLREQQSAAYLEFMAAAEIANLELAHKAHHFSAERARAAIVELTRTAAAVDVYGSREAAQSALDLWNYVALELDVDDVLAMTDDEWTEPSDKIRRLLRAFRNAARKDLNHKSLPATAAELTTARPN
jgi:hypothetical protein